MRRPSRRCVAGVAVGLLAIGTLAGHAASVSADEDPAERAAREIQAARDRANAAAAAYTEAGLELDRLSEEAEALEVELDELQADVDALGAQVQEVAINSFMSAGVGTFSILEGPQVSTQRLVSNELVATATNSSTEALDDYDEARHDLEDKSEELDDKQGEVEASRERYEGAREQAEAEVVRLQEVEAQRLEDERVRRILEAQRAEELRQQQAAAEAAAEAAEPAEPGTDAEAVAGEAEPADAAEEPEELLYTRTMADLYARQGLYTQALEVVRHLRRRRPDDTDLATRQAELEARLDAEGDRTGRRDPEPTPETVRRSALAAAPALIDPTERVTVDAGAAGGDPGAATDADADSGGESIREYLQGLLAWPDRRRAPADGDDPGRLA
jgi:peptidoglycan hydrolase CwlO-like protein